MEIIYNNCPHYDEGHRFKCWCAREASSKVTSNVKANINNESEI